uniref:ATP synthase subunit delta n=1 Tax=Mesoaciditoga lauensis TaxID=1495039 RepID=A0A7V3RDL0_9BACT
MRIRRALAYKYAMILEEISDQKLFTAIETLSTLDDDRIRSFIFDPTVSPESKSKIISEVFGLDEKSKKFFEILFHHKRFSLIVDIKEIAKKIWMRKNGFEDVKIRNAMLLTDEEKDRIAKTIKQIRKTEPILHFHEEPELLAGVIIDFEDSMIDLSAYGALKEASLFISGGK